MKRTVLWVVIGLLIISLVLSSGCIDEPESTKNLSEETPDETQDLDYDPTAEPIQDLDCDPITVELIATNEPDHYLGEYIAQEAYSDWKNYAPLVNKVNELIAGLSNNYDKAEAIASWIQTSKSYGHPSFQDLEDGTVIDIFNLDTGICYDASVLTTAMFRLAGIPARSIHPGVDAFHAYTEVFLNGKWLGVDTTFTENGDISFFDVTSIVYTFDYENTSDTCVVKTKAKITDSKFTDFSNDYLKVIQRDDYGSVVYPLTSGMIYYDEAGNYALSREELPTLESSGSVIQCSFVAKNMECDYRICTKTDGQDTPIGMPTTQFRAYDNELKKEIRLSGENNGYYSTKLPANEYRFKCGFGGTDVAYTDITIDIDGSIKITPESLNKYDGVNQKIFDLVIQALRESAE